jgi:putative MATE family efflux protein
MYAMALGAGLNIVLDPIFIYTLDLGVPGAAWATLVSLSISSAIMFNWLFLKKNTYVSFPFRGFKFDKSIIVDILRVGWPASVQQLSMSIMMAIVNVVLVMVAGTDGVAIYSTGWRIATIAILPLLGIATAVVSVTGAAYGARDAFKLKTAFLYSVKIGFIIEVCIASFTFIFAPWIVAIFTQAEAAAHIAPDLVLFLRIVSLFYPGTAFGMLSSSMFQGTGKGIYSLLVTLLRTVILTTIFTLLFAFVFNLGLPGIWWAIVCANLSGSATAFAWSHFYMRRLTIKFKKPTSSLQ